MSRRFDGQQTGRLLGSRFHQRHICPASSQVFFLLDGSGGPSRGGEHLSADAARKAGRPGAVDGRVPILLK